MLHITCMLSITFNCKQLQHKGQILLVRVKDFFLLFILLGFSFYVSWHIDEEYRSSQGKRSVLGKREHQTCKTLFVRLSNQRLLFFTIPGYLGNWKGSLSGSCGGIVVVLVKVWWLNYWVLISISDIRIYPVVKYRKSPSNV